MELAPAWPYPVYDRAFTHLVRKDFDAALADYRRTIGLFPRGFFTALTAVDTLTHEREGEFPPGLYLAFVMLEPVREPDQRRDILEQLVEKYPSFAPGGEKHSELQADSEKRLEAIERGLEAAPDPETKGTLELSKALAFRTLGREGEATQLLEPLSSDSESTLKTEAWARELLLENGALRAVP